MSFNAWTRLGGYESLRKENPSGFEQTDTAAFVLGIDAENVYEELDNGDYVEVSPNINPDLTGISFVRAHFLIRGPLTAPGTGTWKFSILIDDVEHVAVDIPSGRARLLQDLRAHVSKLTGQHKVAFRLGFQ